MPETQINDPLISQRQDLEAQLAAVSRQEAMKDQAVIAQLQAAFADPAVSNLITTLQGAMLYNPARQANVRNILMGITAHREVIAHMVADVSASLPAAPAPDVT